MQESSTNGIDAATRLGEVSLALHCRHTCFLFAVFSEAW
jgi:hypothetical protein